jgi:hypothetical protein
MMRSVAPRIAVPCVNLHDGTKGIDGLLTALAPAWEPPEPVSLTLPGAASSAPKGPPSWPP